MFCEGSIQCFAIISFWRISPRFLENIGGNHPQFLGRISTKSPLRKNLCFSDADPVSGLSRSDAVVVFAFVWSYSDLGNNGHSWPMMMMMRMMMPMTI